MDLTPQVNQSNVERVREQIMKKKYESPYHATQNMSAKILTDYDTFPYPRYWRGVPTSDFPVVAEREAGWRPRFDNCYKFTEPMQEVPYPKHCFQTSCSTIYPCFSSYDKTFNDREILNKMINDNCVVQYR